MANAPGQTTRLPAGSEHAYRVGMSDVTREIDEDGIKQQWERIGSKLTDRAAVVAPIGAAATEAGLKSECPLDEPRQTGR